MSAGSAALKAEATRLMHARNRISSRISRCSLSHFRPDLAEASSFSFCPSVLSCLGRRIISHSTAKAVTNVNRSTAITASMPAKENRAVAITGVRMVLSEFENDRRPLVRW